MYSIDIIIPCYYASEIIKPCFEKLAKQTYRNFRVIMVNDCSPFTDDEYADIRNEYSDKMNLWYYKTETNSGPGVARQLGIDKAAADFVIFIDDDDELYDETTLQRFIDAVNGKDVDKIIVITGKKLHTWDDGSTRIVEPNYHHQGTMYNLSLIKKHNIRYETDISFKEEDGAFSSLVFLYGIKYDYKEIHSEGIMYIKKWSFNHTSLCSKVDTIDSFINFMISKIFFLIYLDKLQIDDGGENNTDDAILIPPICFNNLILHLASQHLVINENQFNLIEKYICKYIELIKKLNIDLSKAFNNQTTVNLLKHFFDNNTFYGEFNPKDVEEVIENYQLILDNLKNYVQ